MASLNKVMIIGNLGRDVDMRYTPGGKAVASFSVAVNRKFTRGDGSKDEQTEWFNVETWGKTAEFCAAYLRKGRMVFVEGRLQTDTYEKDGATKYFTKIVAQEIQALDRDRSGDNGNSAEVAEEIVEDIFA